MRSHVDPIDAETYRPAALCGIGGVDAMLAVGSDVREGYAGFGGAVAKLVEIGILTREEVLAPGLKLLHVKFCSDLGGEILQWHLLCARRRIIVLAGNEFTEGIGRDRNTFTRLDREFDLWARCLSEPI